LYSFDTIAGLTNTYAGSVGFEIDGTAIYHVKSGKYIGTFAMSSPWDLSTLTHEASSVVDVGTVVSETTVPAFYARRIPYSDGVLITASATGSNIYEFRLP